MYLISTFLDISLLYIFFFVSPCGCRGVDISPIQTFAMLDKQFHGFICFCNVNNYWVFNGSLPPSLPSFLSFPSLSSCNQSVSPAHIASYQLLTTQFYFLLHSTCYILLLYTTQIHTYAPYYHSIFSPIIALK